MAEEKPIPQIVIDKVKEYEEGGKITIDELLKIVEEQGCHMHLWTPKQERNPLYPEGNNESRVGFVYNPYFHPKGKFFQGVIKKLILKFTDYIHSKIIKHYDKDAFVFDDPRLKTIQEFSKKYANQNFQESFPYKYNLMIGIIDIVLLICKEDIYYRARILDWLYGVSIELMAMLIELIKEQTGEEDSYKQHSEALRLLHGLQEYILTEQEAENINKHH